MAERKSNILFMVGDGYSLQEISSFKRYILDELQFPPEQVKTLLCADLSDEQILDEISDIFEKARHNNTPLVMVYSGHGIEGSFCPNGNKISYFTLAERMLGADFLFINASCYSGSSIDTLKKRKLLPKRGSVIAATMMNSPGPFLEHLVESFRNKRPFRKRKIRGGLITGKIIVGSGELTETTNAIGSNKEIYPGVREIIYKKPKRSVDYEPIRCGRCLDYLLFPD